VARGREKSIMCGLAQILDSGMCTMGRCAELHRPWSVRISTVRVLAAMATAGAGTLLCEQFLW